MTSINSTNFTRNTVLHVSKFADPSIHEEKIEVTDKLSLDLHELIPSAKNHSKISEWPDMLQKYLCLVKLGIEAFEKFELKQMCFFDPLVGDTACQIRASILVELCHQSSFEEDLKNVQQVMYRLEDKIVTLLSGKIDIIENVKNFESFLKHHKIDMKLREDFYVVLSSYSLTKSKDVDYSAGQDGTVKRRERLVPEKLVKNSKISLVFKKKLTEVFQKGLSESSVAYVQRIAFTRLTCEEERACARLVFGVNVKTDKLHRKMTPCYPTMRLILDNMLNKQIMLVFKVEQYIKNQPYPYGSLSLVFEVNKEGRFVPTVVNHSRLKKGSLFFCGKTLTDKPYSVKDLTSKILSYDVKDLILGDAAAHPQYGIDDKTRPNDPNYEAHRRFAEEHHISRVNPPPFYMLEHIFCGNIQDYISGSVNPFSWFKSAFGGHTLPDRSEKLKTETKEIPICFICKKHVSEPIALKCGDIFDKHCLKDCLNSGYYLSQDDGLSSLVEGKNVQEADFVKKPDIYEQTKCKIRAAIFSRTSSILIKTEASIFSTMEKIQEKVLSVYLNAPGCEKEPTVRSMTVRGSYTFYPGKTLADYQVLPGEETLMWVFLA